MSKLPRTSRRIAPEDIRVGDYLAISQITQEFLMSDCAQAWQRDVETSRVRYIPEQSGRPLKVLGVCLPFVLVRRPDGRHVTLDLRRHHVVRLSKSYGRRAFAGIAANSRDKTANKCT